MWLPSPEVPPSDLDLETSRFVLKQVGDHFCDLLIQEKEACNEHMSEGKQFKTIFLKEILLLIIFYFCRKNCCLETCSTRCQRNV